MYYNKNFTTEENVILLGLAFDNDDNHKRVTKGENFYILGGSSETHEKIVKKVMTFNETIKKYGKKLEELSKTEFYTIVKKINKDSQKIQWHYNNGNYYL